MPSIGEFLATVAGKSRSCRSEDEFRFLFLSELKQFCESAGVPTEIRIEESLQTGRSDARVGGVVYEFKKPFRLDESPVRREAFEEIRRHLVDSSKKQDLQPQKLQGFISDGKWASIVMYHGPSKTYVPVDVYERIVDEDQAFVALQDAGVWLERILRVLARRELSPENLLEDFGPGTALCHRLVAALWDKFEDRKSDKRTAAFFEQWRILFSTATQKLATARDLSDEAQEYGVNPLRIRTDHDVRLFLFMVHTYYSLILKLLTMKIADELGLLGTGSMLRYIMDDPAEGLRQAEANLPRLAVNLVERDVFSWFEDGLSHDLSGGLQEAARRFEIYDVTGVRRDVLKRVYQKIIPTKLRKALGEFYTKDWAADRVLDELGFEGKGTILDPACGSGTFLSLAIDRKKSFAKGKGSSDLLDEILSSIVGFDINPIAVTTARMNYLLSILDLLKTGRRAGGVRLPVYLCDSVVLPEITFDLSTGSGKAYVLQTSVGELRIPAVEPQEGSFGLERILLRQLEQYAGRSVDEFLDATRQKLGAEYELQFRPLLRSLHEQIAQLERDGVNGIWARFVENFFAPLLVDKFDFVVGNPPWVAPVHVPKRYRDKVREIVRTSGFQQPYDPHFVATKARIRAAEEAYVACLPFVHMALTRYLKPTTGRLAFLLTSSLIRTRNAGGWRNKVLGFDLQKIVDLSLITDIHEGALCWSFIPIITNSPSADLSSKVVYEFATRAGEMTHHRRRPEAEQAPELKIHTWNLTKQDLPLDPSNLRSPWLTGPKEIVQIFRQMQRFPRIADSYRINNGVNPAANEIYMVTDPKPKGANYAEVKRKDGTRVIVEKDMIFPLVKGQHIHAWTFENEYILLPHDPLSGKPYPMAVMEKRFRETLAYFSKHKERLEKRRFFTPGRGLFYAIYAVSRSKLASWKVCYAKHSTQLEVCVLPPKIRDHKLDVSRNIVLDTSAYFINSPNERESHFLAGTLNSLPLRTVSYVLGEPKGGPPYKQFFQWTIGVLRVPKFDPDNNDHKELADLSQAAHRRKQEDYPEHERKIDELVMSMYGLSKKDATILSSHLRLLQGEREG